MGNQEMSVTKILCAVPQLAVDSCRDSPLSVGGRLGPLHVVMRMHSQLNRAIHHGHHVFCCCRIANHHHMGWKLVDCGRLDHDYFRTHFCTLLISIHRGKKLTTETDPSDHLWGPSGSIIHTAALHAPNLDFYTEADFRRINLDGTRHVLNAAMKMGETAGIPVVFSSTTSLMNTQLVKEETR